MVAASSPKWSRPLLTSSATNVFKYSLAIFTASILLGLGLFVEAFGSIGILSRSGEPHGDQANPNATLPVTPTAMFTFRVNLINFPHSR